jgi:hypothetical protein
MNPKSPEAENILRKPLRRRKSLSILNTPIAWCQYIEDLELILDRFHVAGLRPLIPKALDTKELVMDWTFDDPSIA